MHGAHWSIARQPISASQSQRYRPDHLSIVAGADNADATLLHVRRVVTTVAIAAADPAPAPSAPASPVLPSFGPQLATGLVGVLLASFTAGLNEHVTEVALADVRGALAIGHDEGSWLTALYAAANVAAMAFAPWCSVTFSLRRFTIGAVLTFALLGLLCPLAPDVGTLCVLRTLQGLAGGSLPPMLMTVALRYLPAGIKIYGLAGYALTATFGPSLGTPLAALWTEFVGWPMVFWQVVPLCLLSALAIGWGVPQDPLRLERLATFDWIGLLAGLPAIAMLVIALEQGDRLDWLRSPLICALFTGGGLLMLLFLVNEWSHPAPFFKLQMLGRRNFAHALITLAGVLVIFLGVIVIPGGYLAEVRGYRPLQTAPLALVLALPQLVALPLTAAILNVPRVDCRWVLGIGLGMVATSCALGRLVTADWVRENFYLLQALQIMGQPMAVIPLLMLATTGLPPAEGPWASAMFNTVKGFAAALGTAIVEGLGTVREHYHSEILVDRLGLLGMTPDASASADLAERIRAQSVVLMSADLYLVMAAIAVGLILLIPIMPTRIYPPRAIAPAAPR
ncbi:MFS transporter [Sphingomonas morindae]|uniref:MFS transporter n=1 Tax=Sphingomonas morindae TaxID=1541170 RepID=A0ABY4X3U7_9SPHN|nr:MFS transporter [Sphingomonas morindae]USI71563.1 MFS transporter [Sphingomonas morindae]